VFDVTAGKQLSIFSRVRVPEGSCSPWAINIRIPDTVEEGDGYVPFTWSVYEVVLSNSTYANSVTQQWDAMMPYANRRGLHKLDLETAGVFDRAQFISIPAGKRSFFEFV
jgi:hypothetical protein